MLRSSFAWEAAFALSISMQKRSSPFFAVAFVMVFVLANAAGKAELKLMSTLTGTEPAAMGNFIASKVSEPVPKGSLHAFETEASPEQCNSCPSVPLIVRSKVAPVTASLSSPLPVKVAFCPRVMDEGEKVVILVFVLAPPQSFHVNDKSVAVAEAMMRAAAVVDFMLADEIRESLHADPKTQAQETSLR